MQNTSSSIASVVAEELVPDKLKKLSMTEHIARIEVWEGVTADQHRRNHRGAERRS